MATTYVDGDIIVYRCGYAAQKTKYELRLPKDAVLLSNESLQILETNEEGFVDVSTYSKVDGEALSKQFGKMEIKKTLEVEPIENCLHSVKLMLQEIKDNTKADSLVIYLSGPTNFRHEIATIQPYKGNRASSEQRQKWREEGKYLEWLDRTEDTYTYQPKPVLYNDIREYLINHHGAIVTEGIEADDALGIACHNKGPDVCLASIDKDLNMISCRHYDFVKKEEYFVDEDVADFNFFLQLLQGDATDNIPGIPGVGPAVALKLLTALSPEDNPCGWRTIVEKVWELYYVHTMGASAYAYYSGKLAADEVSKLLWILREEPLRLDHGELDPHFIWNIYLGRGNGTFFSRKPLPIGWSEKGQLRLLKEVV